jgi:hypothetical protein
MTMHRSMIWLLASCAWGVCLWWTLLLQKLPTSAFGEHTVCGAWGCGPPLPVLLACHVFWMVLLTPPAFVTALRLPAHRVRFFGTLLVVLGLSGLVAVGVWEAATWLREASEWQRRFFVQRYLFSIVTLTDFPILEILIVGAGLWLAEGRRSRSAIPTSSGEDEMTAPAIQVAEYER